MTAIVQIIRETSTSSWSEAKAVQTIIRRMSFDDVASAKEYAKDFGEQHGADFKSTYTAQVVEATSPVRYTVLYRVTFDGDSYRLSDDLVAVDLMDPAQKKAHEGNGAYSLGKDGEIKELSVGMITNGRWWTSDPFLAEDFNREIGE